MTLIKSISGIRGTIGGKAGDGLSPLDTVKFVSAYAQWIINNTKDKKRKVVVGRDARISGEMVNHVVVGTLMGMGIDVIDIGLATTPTTEIAVTNEKAHGGIILTASHNPKQWNALKLLNYKGEFLSAADGEQILDIAEKENFNFSGVDELGKVEIKTNYLGIHIQQILDLPLVDVNAIKEARFRIAVDAVNSVGGTAIPALLKALGVQEVIELYCEPNGIFPHNPEPLPEHLTEISKVVKNNKAHLGFVVDPDVDRLAIVNEDGTMFGEEYTLVAVADYILKNKPGNTVSNLSSTRALRNVTESYGGNYFASAVGEVNVVESMKKYNAVIGGEGNGGVIYPEIHYGRDALVGIALFLTHLAKTGKKCSQLRAQYPEYVISKNKIELTPQINVDQILESVKSKFSDFQVVDIDGVKIEFEHGWVHLRKSNTEPIIRIYAESKDMNSANELAGKIISEIRKMI
ncbi:MAG: phosphoglucosamine mutase [Bacteroidetes bacterium GWC2_33_15]|nr:MAG: phosphoglucosamine mutase [Bacteroidetes bacterium GWA2_33_15]OFX50168.1 MAG: phosphoglucosamine mutase [Bacteroidetes bacterium GWC2_33_15]OFX65320.1 MAG: phosphoglucosamine mutase [Bacteroidetes bacterium GWB2_32_14]OFX70547.1 MAG: phosphoglucosamine mutase [Bacteroidetes bacterium GWD2_33_33]HAN19579.1 phosphoglucosamine mutase [Bacteroidales bacterium]